MNAFEVTNIRLTASLTESWEGLMEADFWWDWEQMIMSSGETTFQRRPYSFLVFLIILLLSNLFAYVIRIYKKSIPETNVTIINILNLYIVELLNVVATVLVGNGLTYLHHPLSKPNPFKSKIKDLFTYRVFCNAIYRRLFEYCSTLCFYSC